MLTLVESLSLAGDREKQNDDAAGFARGSAWVIDGATDLDDAPLSGAASDAAWLAHYANAYLHTSAGDCDLRTLIEAASAAARDAFLRAAGGPPSQRWKWPIASLLLCAEHDDQLIGLHLGDCRLFALGADGASHEAGPAHQAAEEMRLAATQTDAHMPLLERVATLDTLRRMRASANQPGAAWTFALDPACAAHAALWSLKLHRPADIILATDGFAALVDRYHIHDLGSLIRAAREDGLQELGRQLRAVETADALGTRHPRIKPHDDATALLLRLT